MNNYNILYEKAMVWFENQLLEINPNSINTMRFRRSFKRAIVVNMNKLINRSNEETIPLIKKYFSTLLQDELQKIITEHEHNDTY